MNKNKIQVNFDKLRKVIEQIRSKFIDQKSKKIFQNYVETFMTKLKDGHDKEFFEAFKQVAKSHLIIKEENIINYRNTLAMLLLLNTILKRIESRMIKHYNNLNKNFFLKLWSDIYNHAIHITNLLSNKNESDLRIKIDSENYNVFKLQLFTILEIMRRFTELFQKKKKTNQVEIIKDIEKRTIEAGLNPNENFEVELDIIDEQTDLINHTKKPSCIISSAKKANVRFILKSLEKNREEIYGFIQNENLDFFELNDLTANYIKNFQKLQDLVKSSKTERLTFEIENKFKKEYYFSEFLISISQQAQSTEEFQFDQLVQIIKEKYQQIFLQNLQQQKNSIIEEDPFIEQYEEIQNQTIDSKMSKRKVETSQVYKNQFLKPIGSQNDVSLSHQNMNSLSSISSDIKHSQNISLSNSQATFENNRFLTFKQQNQQKIKQQEKNLKNNNQSIESGSIQFSKSHQTRQSQNIHQSITNQDLQPKITFQNFFSDNNQDNKKFQSQNFMRNSLFTNKGSTLDSGPQLRNNLQYSKPLVQQPQQQDSDLKFSHVISRQPNIGYSKQQNQLQIPSKTQRNSMQSSKQMRNSNVSISFKQNSLRQSSNLQKQSQQNIKPLIQIDDKQQTTKNDIQNQVQNNISMEDDDISLKSFVNNNDQKLSFNIEDFNSADFVDSEPQVSSGFFKKKQSSQDRFLIEQQNLSSTKINSNHKKNMKSLTLHSDPQDMEMDVYYQAQKDKIFDQIRKEIQNTDYKIQNNVSDLLFELWSLTNDYVQTKKNQKESFSERYIQKNSQQNTEYLIKENQNLKQLNEILKNTNQQLEKMKQFDLDQAKKDMQMQIEQQQMLKQQNLLNQIQNLKSANKQILYEQIQKKDIQHEIKKNQMKKIQIICNKINVINLDAMSTNQTQQRVFTIKHQLNLLRILIINFVKERHNKSPFLQLQNLKKQIIQYRLNLKRITTDVIFEQYKQYLIKQKSKIRFEKKNNYKKEKIFLQQRIVELYKKINDLQDKNRNLQDKNDLIQSQNFELNLQSSITERSKADDQLYVNKKSQKELQTLAYENQILQQKIINLESVNRDLKHRKQNLYSTQLIELNRENRRLQDIIKQDKQFKQKNQRYPEFTQSLQTSEKKARNSQAGSQKNILRSSQQLETYSNRGINFLNRFEMMLDLPTQDKQNDKYDTFINYIVVNQQKDFSDQILCKNYTIFQNQNILIEVKEKYKKTQGYFHFNYELKVSNLCFFQISLFNIKLITKSNFVKFRKNQSFENLVINKRDIKSFKFDVIFKENYILEMLPLKMTFNVVTDNDLSYQNNYKNKINNFDSYKEIYFPITINKLVEFVSDKINMQIIDQLRKVSSMQISDEQYFMPGQLQKIIPNLQNISSKIFGVKIQTIYGSTIIIVDFKNSLNRQINFYSVEKNVIHSQYQKLLQYLFSKINQNKNQLQFFSFFLMVSQFQNKQEYTK